MSEAVKAFTVGTAECRVLSDGIMAYEPDALYTGLPSEQTGPVVGPLLDDRGLAGGFLPTRSGLDQGLGSRLAVGESL